MKRTVNQSFIPLLPLCKMRAVAFGVLAAFAGLLGSCVGDPAELPKTEPEPAAEVDPFIIPVEEALDGMYDLMDELYGVGTRASSCTVASIETVKGSDIFGAETRATSGAFSGDLVYVVNFANDGGFAVMGANRAVDEVLCIAESGSFDVELMESIASDIVAGQTPTLDTPSGPDDTLDENQMMFKIPEQVLALWMVRWIAVLDMNGNGIPDYIEPGFNDSDFDGIPNQMDDSDGDGLMDSEDGDDDNDGIPDMDDRDIDGDGVNEPQPPAPDDSANYNQLDLNGNPVYPKYEYYYDPWRYTMDWIKPLLTTKWDQWTPYNMYCPDGAPAGCVAIAVAQIIAYEEFPYVNFVVSSWAELKAYDYDVFLSEDKPKPGSAGYRYVRDLAQIIKVIGDRVYMDYSKNSSTAAYKDASDFLSQVGYNAKFKEKYNLSDVKGMLNRSNPVFIGAAVEGKKIGHAWVIDGYCLQKREVARKFTDRVPDGKGGYKFETHTSYFDETRELLHCNFGWRGISDGYYLSEVFDAGEGPIIDDDNNSGTNGGLYNTKYNMILY